MEAIILASAALNLVSLVEASGKSCFSPSAVTPVSTIIIHLTTSRLSKYSPIFTSTSVSVPRHLGFRPNGYHRTLLICQNRPAWSGYSQMERVSSTETGRVSGQTEPALEQWPVWSYGTLSVQKKWGVTDLRNGQSNQLILTNDKSRGRFS